MRREFCPNNIIMGKFERKRNISQISTISTSREEKKRPPAGGFVASALFNSRAFGIGIGLADQLTDRLSGWLADWLDGWLTGLLADFLTDWLTECRAEFLTD